MKYRLRLHAIPLADSDGGRAFTFRANDLAATVQRTNQIFAPAEIELFFDPLTDWEPMQDTELNTMDRGGPNWPRRPNEIAARYAGKLVVFFRFGDGASASGNGNAYPPDIGRPIPPSWRNERTEVNFVTMPSTQPLIDQNPSFFAHELAHYLGLYHTFPFTWDGPILQLAPGETLTPAQAEERLVRFIRQNGGTLAALNGDLLDDTTADPGTAFWLFHGHEACRGVDSVTLSGTLDGAPYNFTLTPPRANVMSYYACANAGFTAQQIERMHATLAHASRAHLLPKQFVTSPHLGLQAAAGAPTRLAVAITGSDGLIYTARWDQQECNQQWQGWWRITNGAAFAGSPITVVARDANKLDFFVVPGDGAIWTAAYDRKVAHGAFRGWWKIVDGRTIPKTFVGAVARQPHMLDIFITGTDGQVYTAAWEAGRANDQWRGWWRIGNINVPPGAPVTAVARQPHMLDVFITDSNGQIKTAAWEAGRANDAWRGWWRIRDGAAPAGACVTAVARQPHMLDVFVVAGDKRVYTAAWEAGRANDAWRGWWSIVSGQAQPGSSVPVVSRGPGMLDVFVAGLDGHIWTAAWEAGRANDAWRGWWRITPELC